MSFVKDIILQIQEELTAFTICVQLSPLTQTRVTLVNIIVLTRNFKKRAPSPELSQSLGAHIS